MANQIIKVPDIAILTASSGSKQLISLRDKKIKKENLLHAFHAGSGVKHDGNLYVLEEDMTLIVSMTTAASSLSFLVGRNADIEVDWGDGTRERNVFGHTYTDVISSHDIKFYGSKKALTTLNCSSSQLTSLDVSNNVALTDLTCFGNQLTSLDVSNNVALTGLTCSGNQLTSLDVSNNIALTHLACNENQLINLDVNSNTELRSLVFSKNQVCSLGVSKNIKLIQLNCDGNQLTNLDVSNNVALTSLGCSGNQLTNLNVSKNIKLIQLNCTGNQLTNLDVSNNIALTHLGCGGNQLTNLNVSKNAALIDLTCESTPIVNNQSSLTELANSLPVRELGSEGVLGIDNPGSVEWIQTICESKNWRIEIFGQG